MKCMLLISILFAIGSSSFASQKVSFEEASPEAKKMIMRELIVAVPAYLVESEKVLEIIEKNAADKKITDQTILSQTKIQSLYSEGQSRLSKILTDSSFREGRSDVNVLWLKESIAQLKNLNKILAEVYKKQADYKKLDSYFINASYSKDEISEDVSVDVLAVSRPYCNLTFSYSKTDGGTSVNASELCD